MVRPRTVHDVAARQLCTGCGVCAYVAPQQIRMVDVLDHGRRPLPVLPNRSSDGRRGTDTGFRGSSAEESDCSGGSATEALACCPGAGLTSETRRPEPGEIAELRAAWGPVRALWEGYAADSEIRFAGSSGGAVTALAAYCLDHEGMAGVLHIGPRPDAPLLNSARLSRSREELLAAAGSRYAPASPCERLDLVEAAEGPCVFVGKPCDVAAVRAARRVRPALDARIGLTIAVFCAGTPTTRGTLDLLHRLGVTEPDRLASVHYRGQGWPGRARVRLVDDPPAGPGEPSAACGRAAPDVLGAASGISTSVDRSLSYQESWGEVLQQHRQWRCHLCPDHTGEFADVSVGDPWYRPTGDDPGRSLVVARTERGRQLVEAAIAAGVLVLAPVAPWVLPASQPNLLLARGAVWGRVRTLRLAGLAAPRFRRLPMAGLWWRHLSGRQKLQSTVGTLRRVRRRRLWERADLTPYEERPAPPR